MGLQPLSLVPAFGPRSKIVVECTQNVLLLMLFPRGS